MRLIISTEVRRPIRGVERIFLLSQGWIIYTNALTLRKVWYGEIGLFSIFVEMRGNRLLIVLLLFTQFQLKGQFRTNDPLHVPFRKGSLWGVCDINRKIVLEPQFDSVLMYVSGGYKQTYKILPRGSFVVKHNGKYGLLHKEQLVIKPMYDYIGYKKNGMFLAFTKNEDQKRYVDVYNTSGTKLNKVPLTSFSHAQQQFYVLEHGPEKKLRYDMIKLRWNNGELSWRYVFVNCSVIRTPSSLTYLLGNSKCKDCYAITKNGLTTHYRLKFMNGTFAFVSESKQGESKSSETNDVGRVRGTPNLPERKQKRMSGGRGGLKPRPGFEKSKTKSGIHSKSKNELPKEPTVQWSKTILKYNGVEEKEDFGNSLYYWVGEKRCGQNYYFLDRGDSGVNTTYGLTSEGLILPPIFDTIIGYYNSQTKMPLFILRMQMEDEWFSGVLKADSQYLVPLSNKVDITGYLVQKELILFRSTEGVGCLNHALDTIIPAKFQDIISRPEYDVVAELDNQFCMFKYHPQFIRKARLKGCFKDHPRRELSTPEVYIKLFEMVDSRGQFMGFAYASGNNNITYFYED